MVFLERDSRKTKVRNHTFPTSAGLRAFSGSTAFVFMYHVIGKKPDSWLAEKCNIYAMPARVTLISRVRFLRPPDKAEIPTSACGERTNVTQIYYSNTQIHHVSATFCELLWKFGRMYRASLSLFQTLQRLIRRTFLPAMRFQSSSFRNFQHTKCSLGCKMRG